MFSVGTAPSGRKPTDSEDFSVRALLKVSAAAQSDRGKEEGEGERALEARTKKFGARTRSILCTAFKTGRVHFSEGKQGGRRGGSKQRKLVAGPPAKRAWAVFHTGVAAALLSTELDM